MLIHMIGNITQATYEKICGQWVRMIILLSESQIDIWAPLSGGYGLMQKFSQDKELQDKLFGKIPYSMAYVDSHEIDNLTYEEFEQQFFASINVDPQGASVDQYVGTHNNQLFGLMLMGFDTALDRGNLETIKKIGTLLDRHSHVSMVFVTELPVPEMPIYHELLSKQIFIGNIGYQPLFNSEDSLAFLHSLEEKWHFKFSQGFENIFAENIGGHVLLLEEAARIVRDNPQISFKEVLAHQSLLRKAEAIFHSLTPYDQETMRGLLFEKKATRISEYLEKTHMVVDGKVGLQYFNYMYHNLLSMRNPFKSPTNSGVHLRLTYLEHKIFDLLSSNDRVIKREEIAKAIWEHEAAEKYSDWAIDQVIHRLREKIEKGFAPYEIQTKKGEGFILLAK